MTKIKSAIKNFTDIIPVDYLFAAVCFAFFIASGFAIAFTENYTASILEITNSINVFYFLTVFAVCLLSIVAIAYLLNKKCYIARSILISVLFFGIITMIFNSDDVYLILGFALITFVTVYWCMQNNRVEVHNFELSNRLLIISIFLIALLVASFIFVVSLCRYLSFNAHNYDFGIFTSMFESMKRTGLPVIINERNVLMSHFGVHFSPFFYLLLPIYFVFPSPITLIVLQTLFITAGVIPLVLICKHFKLQNVFILMISAVYLLYPGFVLAGMNDFHENAFLSFVILFLFYFMLKNKNLWFFIFLAMLFSIKEDAVIYAITIGLFMLFYKRMYLKSVIVIALSVVYFIFASAIVESLNLVNSGVMTDRFINYMPDGENNLMSAIHTCIFNFPYVIGQVFISEKLIYLCWVLVPVAFMPFMSKRKSLLILLLPLLVINLMPSWPYQYDIGFQYTFGSGVLVIIASLMVLSEKANKKKAVLGVISLIMSIMVFFGTAYTRIDMINEYVANPQMYANWDALIDKLPQDEEYTATSRIIAHMSKFPNVYFYPNFYSEQKVTRYLIAESSDADNLPEFIQNNNYQLVKIESGLILYECKNFN